MTKRTFKCCFGLGTILLVIMFMLMYHSILKLPKYDPDWTPRNVYNTNISGQMETNMNNARENLILFLHSSCDKPITKPNKSNIIHINKIWQVLRTHSPTMAQVLIFGAYFDARPNIVQETVRLLGVATNSIQQRVYCQLWFSNFTSPLIVAAVIKDTGRGLGVGSIKFQERLYSCEIPDNVPIPPHSVSMTFSDCDNSSNLIPVHFPSPTKVHDLGICVVVAYGTLNPTALVEWIEFNLLLGVGEINVYDSRIDEKSRKVFEHYQEQGIVKLYESAPPMNNNWCKWCQKLAVIPALNDCMYRNMFRYKHLMVIDFDEFIIPVVENNLLSLISKLRSTWQEEPATYLFRNAYHFKEYQTLPTATQYLTTHKYLNRTEPSKFGYSPKSIINPKRCVIMQNHYCMIKTPDVPASGLLLNVKPESALSHHYKSCHLKPTECKNYLQHPVLDNSILKFTKPLNISVFKKLKVLKLL